MLLLIINYLVQCDSQLRQCTNIVQSYFFWCKCFLKTYIITNHFDDFVCSVNIVWRRTFSIHQKESFLLHRQFFYLHSNFLQHTPLIVKHELMYKLSRKQQQTIRGEWTSFNLLFNFLNFLYSNQAINYI